MSHLVDQIVSAMMATLTGLPTTGANVFDGMPRVMGEEQLPFLVIDEGDDRSGPVTTTRPRLWRHTQNFTVTAYVKASMPRATLRQIRLEVEKALSGADPNLAGSGGVLTRDVRPVGAQAPIPDFSSELQVISMGINVEIDYQHDELTPDVAS